MYKGAQGSSAQRAPVALSLLCSSFSLVCCQKLFIVLSCLTEITVVYLMVYLSLEWEGTNSTLPHLRLPVELFFPTSVV